MVIASKNHFRQYPFVDREDHIQTFKEAVTNIGQKEFSVLVYYGVAGIGKTSLRKMFPKYLEEYNLEYQQQEVIWASIDLQLANHREKNTFLIALKNELQRKSNKYLFASKLHFPAFEIAHAIYWKKANPEIPLRKENYLLFEGAEAFDSFFGVVDKIPYFSLVPATARLLKGLPDYLRKWWTKRGEVELTQLSDKDPLEIEEMLPYFWAQDLNNYLEHTSKSAVLFIDTYEALWENHRDDGNSLDEWIRDELIHRLPRNVIWVICGREALRWGKIDSEWSEYLTQYEVEELLRKYCMEYLKTREITDTEIQEAIFKGSKGIPYYLELSACTYEKIVENRKPKTEDFGENHQKIADRFFRFLGHEEKNALNILSVPHFWDYNLFKYLMKEFNTGYPVNDFEDLCSFSFIDKAENNKLQMHQLMQESLQKTQGKEKPDSVKEIHKVIVDYYTNKLYNIDIKTISSEHETALMEAFYHAKESLEAQDLLNWYITASQPFDRAASWQFIAPMYEEILQILENKLGFEHLDVATTLNNLAGLYYQMGDYEKALQLYQRAVNISENVLGSQHLDVATTINNLAILYENIGDYKKSLPLFQRALDIREKVPGLERDMAITLSCLAGHYEITGDYEKALQLCKRAFEIQEKVLDPLHPDVATTLNNLALLYHYKGDYEKALSLFQKALEIYEKVLGSEHPDVAATLDNLAGLYREIENYEKALQLYKRALDIREKVLGPQHPNVALTLNNLALLYQYKGAYGKALPLYKRALEIYENVLGFERSDVATTVHNLAGLYVSMGDYEKAFPLYQRTLDIREEVLGPQHPAVANSLNSLAELYRQVGNYEKAFPLYQRTLDIREEVLGPQHPAVAQTLNNLAALYENIGDYERALSLYQKALDILERALGSQHSDVAVALNNLAVIYLHMGDYEKVLPLYQRALNIFENLLGQHHPSVAIALDNLAGLYERMREYEKAFPLHQRALRIFEDSLGSEHPDVAVSLKNLASLYEKTGNYEEALPLLERSLDIIEKKMGPNHPFFISIMNIWISVSEKTINE